MPWVHWIFIFLKDNKLINSLKVFLSNLFDVWTLAFIYFKSTLIIVNFASSLFKVLIKFLLSNISVERFNIGPPHKLRVKHSLISDSN